MSEERNVIDAVRIRSSLEIFLKDGQIPAGSLEWRKRGARMAPNEAADSSVGRFPWIREPGLRTAQKLADGPWAADADRFAAVAFEYVKAPVAASPPA